MVWKRRCKVVVLFGYLMLCYSASFVSGRDEFKLGSRLFFPKQQFLLSADSANTVLWDDDAWQKSKEGIEYLDKSVKKKPEKKQEEQDDTPPERDDFRMDEWLKDFFTSTLGKLIAICFVVALLIFTIVRVMTFRESVKRISESNEANQLLDKMEDIDEFDLNALLRATIEKGDFKTAVRILYLIVISELNSKNWIKWMKYKTNHDYLGEMRSRTEFGDFSRLTFIYEVIWYGDRPINEKEFVQLQSKFDEYARILKEPLGE